MSIIDFFTSSLVSDLGNTTVTSNIGHSLPVPVIVLSRLVLGDNKCECKLLIAPVNAWCKVDLPDPEEPITITLPLDSILL